MSEEGITYVCSQCQNSVTVFIKSLVRCGRCGKAMKVVKAKLEPS